MTPGSLAIGGGGLPPHFDKLVLWLEFEGANGSTSLVDSSRYGRTIVSGATLSTAQKKNGVSSLSLPGSGVYTYASTSADFNFGTGDFTIECWRRYVTNGPWLVNRRHPSSTEAGSWGLASGSTVLTWQDSLNGGSDKNSSAFSSTTNIWAHAAVCRKGGTLRMFNEGLKVYEGANSVNYTNSRSLAVGYWTGFHSNMYVDSLLIWNGVGLYETDFTPQIYGR